MFFLADREYAYRLPRIRDARKYHRPASPMLDECRAPEPSQFIGEHTLASRVAMRSDTERGRHVI